MYLELELQKKLVYNILILAADSIYIYIKHKIKHLANNKSHNHNKIKNSASPYLKHLLKTFQKHSPHNPPHYSQCRSTEKSSKRKREEKCSIVNPGD